ncbi:MAG TPA: M15 family metallopeptidase [Candidatus Pelethosoma merdigallinarum]|nr:M15 family metallopeptidase [Candidatus Pelethosoma merdigallinarum]
MENRRMGQAGGTVYYHKKRKLKKGVIYAIIALIIVIAAIFGGIRYYNLINSYPYKLEKAGYNDKEITTITKKLKENEIDQLLEMKYNKLYDDFINEKYFMFKHLKTYVDYYTEDSDQTITHAVAMVNVGANKDHYTDVKQTDTSKDELILVNKYNQLPKDYAPEDLTDISVQYCYGDNEVSNEVYQKYISMYNAAKEEDLYLIITSAFRDYEFQDQLWNQYAKSQGEEWADSVAARAGHSEHQTGLTLDIVTYNSNMNDFENTDEFKWLQKHAHEYGFIMRYPKDKEDITGYDYESWHYRYVGVETATKIHELGITYDEYYAYYLAD